MAKLRSTDDLMKDYLLGTQNQAKEIARDARIEASDPGYLNQRSTRERDAYREEGSHLSDVLQADKGRDLGEQLQDMGVGLMGTFGAIGNTAVLGVAAAGDGLERLVTGESGWEATQQALKDMNSTSEYWNSLRSEKSQAFDRISQYRQDKAIETAGQDADFIERLTAGFSAAAGSYIDNPDQILTDGVSQLPYLLTGGVAKAATTGTGAMSPLVARLAQKMSVESAEKVVQMGIVGGLQGTIEGADAASSTYARVMASTDTFGPGQEGEKEAAALKAAAEAFGIAGATSTITGAIASKFELSPFTAKGSTALARTGDNMVKALLEGAQETIESGTSQFATNLAGNEVLKGKDLVALDQGVGGAAGTGFVVGMGSTAVTNPRSAVDAALTPLTLAGKAFSYVGDRAVATERRGDMEAAQTQADEIVANLTTPAAAAAMNQGTQPDLKTQQQEVLKTLSKMYDELDMKYGKNHFMDDDLQENPEYVAAREAVYQKSEENRVLSDQLNIKNQTVDTPAEEVVLPPEIDTRTQVGLFATGMEYLRGKSMDSDDAVSAFHVLGSVLAAANNIRSLRDGAAADAADTTLPQTDRDKATKALSQLDAIMDNDQLDKWVADFPMEDIESELEDLKKTPEAFGAVIAHLAARNPLKMTDKLIDAGLESKSLPKAQRDSLLLAQELKDAEAELKVGTDPDSSEVSRSIMQTGFPGASDSKQSIADMLRNVTTALAQNDPESAQSYFQKLGAFSQYLTDRAGRFDQALKDMNASGEKAIDVPDTRTWVDGKLTDTPFRLIQGNANSLGVRIAVRKDAETVAKMVAALQKRTGLKIVTPAAKAPTKPAEAKAEKPAPKAPIETKKPAAEASKKPATVDKTDPGNFTDQELDQQISALEGKRKAADRLQYDLLTKERDTRIADLMSGTSQKKVTPKAVDKPVVKKAEPAPVVAAPVDIVIDEDTAVAAEATQEPAAAEAVAEVVSEPSKNHFEDLQPSYPVAAGALVRDHNDAKNHLSQSFKTSDRPGLKDKLPTTAEDLGITDPEDATVVTKVIGYKNQLVSRLQEQIAKKFPKPKRVAMLNGQNFWKESNSHSLYATKWNDDGISYDSVIADIMAWTGIQQMLDMVHPVSWSADKQSQFVATYGDAILPLLQDGWVPLADQAYQMGAKLQTNLGLKPDDTVSLEYTEGTMLALAMDTLAVMVKDASYDGSMETRQIATLKGPRVQWVKVVSDPDLLHDSARAMEGFFPERSSIAAGIVGVKPEKVNSFYRGSRQKIGKEQRKALLKMSQTSHKLSPLLLKLWKAIPEEAGERLFGYKPVDKKGKSLAEVARNGANRTLKGDIDTIRAHIKAVEDHAAENDVEVTDVDSFFEYEMVVNGRAMTKGTSPQSSKLYREMFSTVQSEVDPSKDNSKFMMAVVQGFGIKMDKQPVADSLAELEGMLAKPEVQAALDAAARFASGDMSQLDADLAAFEASGIEMTSHALSAFVHMAEYQKGKPFVSSLSYEIDGLTDGPINLMMMLGLKGSAATMEHWLGLGGLWFGDQKIAVQDKLEELKGRFDGSKDLYEIIAAKASELNADQAKTLLKSVPPDQKQATQRMLQAILHLMHITKLSKSDLQSLTAKHSRAFTKKPTQAAGYLQGDLSIVNDLTDTMLEALSERIDAGEMTDGDWAAVDMFMSHKLVYSKKKKQHFLIKNPPEFEGLKWEGKPLNQKQLEGVAKSLSMFGGSGLAAATMEVIGYQRARMLDAMSLVNAHINYAQVTLQKAYKAKQDIEVAAGRLHPNQALSKLDEQTLINKMWKEIIPHPVLRNTGGLPSSSTSRTDVPRQDVRRIEGALFQRDTSHPERTQLLQVSEASFEDPGVAFAALSVMASGDGSMMTGFFNNVEGNFLNMFDGIYLDPSDIDLVGEGINKEVKENWQFDYIGAVLNSLKMDDPGFIEWADSKEDPEAGSLLDQLKESAQNLKAQQQQQTKVMNEINARPHSVSHMAGHNSPAFYAGTPLNSTTLGTSITDPLLDLAADDLGESVNGIRKMTAADVRSLMKDHTFENPLLKGLWNTLAPLINDNLVLYMSSDKQGMADFYQQNERREMGSDVNGISIGDRVYVRTINAETIVHELLHATTKNLTATYFSNPTSLTPQQRDAMANLVTLMDEFLSMESSSPMVEHVQAVMSGYIAKGDTNSAMQELLAYSLTNYPLQRTLGNTKTSLGKLMQMVFNAIKKMFGFPNGTQSDSMLAHLFSNFEVLTEQAVDMVYTVSVEEALESVNPSLARSFGEVLSRLEKRAATIGKSLGARVDGVTRMQELAKTGLFPTMTSDQLSAGAYLQAMFAVGLQMKAADNALLARVVDAVRDEGPKAFGTDPVLAQARYDFFFENNSNTHDRAADILSLGLVNPEFAKYMEQIVLPKQQIDKRGLNNWLDSLAKSVYELMDTGLILKGNATLGDALEVATLRIRQSMLQSIKRQEAKPGAYRKLTDKLSEGVHLIGEKAGKLADARLQANQTWIGSGLMLVAGIANTGYADMVGKLVLSYSNHMDGMNPAREVIQELVGTNSDNFKLIQLKGIAARMVSAIRQNFREQTPVTVKSWFKELTPEHDELLHTVIGKMATYSLSQNLKDRMEELLTDPTNARADAELLLMSGGNRTKRLLMIKYARLLGDRMANQGNQALYLNTRAIAGLAVHGGGDALTDAEMAALENLSTLQALSHLTPTQRRQTLALYRENTEGFWKATALIDSFFQFDTQRAGKNTATLNMQKGWIPVEADGRKKLKLFQKSEVRKAERMGWVQVGEFKDDPNLVYMATTIGKTPTLSGGAIHAVDFHMNGIHFHSGMPTDPSIQTIITHPKAMADIQRRILNGEVMPYTALYDAAGDVDGFQRLLDPAMVERHTKTVGRLSDAAGIWLGRLHEERVAHGQNQVAADLLAKTWEEGKKDRREKEFVNIRQPLLHKHLTNQQDKVLMNVWETLPYHTKVQLETVFADGSKNPPIWIRRDQLNDAIGYHKASVSNFFTGDNRYQKSTNDNVAALSRQMFGKNAYKYLLTAEEGWQALISSAKDTIIVKSLVVALNNLASNQTQLYMITGNPIWNLRVQSQKHKELVSYLGYQQRIARLKAEELSTADPKAIARVNAEQTFLKNEMRKLSIYPLIEAGEMPTIAEGLSETEEFSMVGDFTEWAEKQMGKMPPVVGTIINNLAVSKETSLYKGLDRMVQYGDFVAKATMYEWLTTQDKAAKTEALELMKNDKTLKWADAIHTVALMEVNDEFVNYARLPGRWRTYGEDMGLLWFYNYKIRILKMGFRRIRKNPAAFLIGSQVGSVLGIATLWDTMPQNINFAYSTGIDPLMSAHETILWNQF